MKKIKLYNPGKMRVGLFAIFVIIAMAGVAVKPAVNVDNGKLKLDTSKLKAEQIYKFND